ncbi:translation initiation factor 2 [Gemmiger formicilis]|uniref:translation initiation factor 2 n=1 Tax=Gemmiger formicilis TaxID=745368 RepID=UPI00195AA8A1|nr:translation initiation factor 2 [Gemmiger formicilis]MBM6715870.1 translation initiation factor 2 [Gemmiger formicilis]
MSKLTVTLPDDLHAQIRQELEEKGITTGQFIEMVVTKYFTKDKKGENDMATRTIAFQVSEELYQRIKDYLKHYEETYGRKLSQKDFMIQLIEAELDAVNEEAEAAAAQEQDPSAEIHDTVGDEPAEDPAESDDEEEPGLDQENNDPDEDSDTGEGTYTEDDSDEATDGESEYGESGDAYTEE